MPSRRTARLPACTLAPTAPLPLSVQRRYRFTAKLPLADAGETAAALRAFIEGGYQGHGEPVPPPPSPFDWLLRGLQAKAGAVGAAMEARVRAVWNHSLSGPVARSVGWLCIQWQLCQRLPALSYSSSPLPCCSCPLPPQNAQALLVELAPVLAVGGLVALLVVGQLAARARSKPKRE